MDFFCCEQTNGSEMVRGPLNGIRNAIFWTQLIYFGKLIDRAYSLKCKQGLSYRPSVSVPLLWHKLPAKCFAWCFENVKIVLGKVKKSPSINIPLMFTLEDVDRAIRPCGGKIHLGRSTRPIRTFHFASKAQTFGLVWFSMQENSWERHIDGNLVDICCLQKVFIHATHMHFESICTYISYVGYKGLEI